MFYRIFFKYLVTQLFFILLSRFLAKKAVGLKSKKSTRGFFINAALNALVKKPF